MSEIYAYYLMALIGILGVIGVGCCVVGFISDIRRSGDEDRIGGPR